jgi:hypothetical protein
MRRVKEKARTRRKDRRFMVGGREAIQRLASMHEGRRMPQAVVGVKALADQRV